MKLCWYDLWSHSGNGFSNKLPIYADVDANL